MTTDTFRNAERRRVVSSDTAESIGAVKGFVMDPTGRTVEAIHVDGRGKHAALLNWSAIQAFGTDAVMATSGAQPSATGSDRELASVNGAVSMLGTRVLTVGGRELGRVEDVEFDTGTGGVVTVRTPHGAIDGGRVRSLGSYALVVDDD